jgi:hypothetical protein
MQSLEWKLKGKRPLGISRLRLEDNIQMAPMLSRVGSSKQAPVAGPCENGYEILGSIEGMEFQE